MKKEQELKFIIINKSSGIGGYTTDPNGNTTHIDFVTIQTKSNFNRFW